MSIEFIQVVTKVSFFIDTHIADAWKVNPSMTATKGTAEHG